MNRIAINKNTRQLYVIYNNNRTIYRYCSLPKDFEQMIEDREENEDSLGRIMSLVRQYCPCAVMDEFPDPVLVDPRAYRDFFD